MSLSDAAWQRWLESDGEARCALFELTYLGSVVGSPSVSQEYHAYVSNMPYVTGGDQTPAHQTFEECVVEVPAFTRRMSETLEGRSTASYGDLILSNECTLDDDSQMLGVGVRDTWLRMNWDGRRIRQWLGSPDWPFEDFRLVLDGRIVDVFDPGGYKIGFHIGDKSSLLDRPVMTTLLGGDGPEAGDLMPLLLGNYALNIRPRLTDTATRFYKITEVDYAGIVERLREDSEILVYEDRNFLGNLSGGAPTITAYDVGADLFTAVDHGLFVNSRVQPLGSGGGLTAFTNYWVIAAGLTVDQFKLSATKGGSAVDIPSDPGFPIPLQVRNWTMDYANGGFTVAGNPSGVITATCWGLRTGGGADVMYSPGDLINEVLTSSLTNTPLTSADIDATNFAAVKTLLGSGRQVVYYLTERTTFAELFDKLMLSVGGWWGFSREGLLQIGRLDLPSAGTPVYSFIADDVASRTMQMARRILPRAQVKLLADPNWTVQSVFAGAADFGDNILYAKPFLQYTGSPTVTTWDTNPASHIGAARPDPYQTYLVGAGGAQDEADRLATLFQHPRAIFSFQTHQVVYLLTIGMLLYIEHPKYTGYGIVVGSVEKIKGRSQLEFFCAPSEEYPSANIPEAGVELAPTLFFEAEFAGSGNLSGYTPELGAPLYPDTGSALADVLLDGAGSIYRTSGSTFVGQSGVPAGDDIALEIAGLFDAGIGAGQQAFVELFAYNDNVDYKGFTATLIMAPDTSADVRCIADGYNGGGDSWASGDVVAGVVLGVQSVLRLEITNARKTVTAKVDGVTLATGTLAGSVPAFGLIGFAIQTIAGSALVKSSFVKGYDL
jgi:hypothetical protein